MLDFSEFQVICSAWVYIFNQDREITKTHKYHSWVFIFNPVDSGFLSNGLGKGAKIGGWENSLEAVVIIHMRNDDRPRNR